MKWPKGINPDLPKPRKWIPLKLKAATEHKQEWFNPFYSVVVHGVPNGQSRGARHDGVVIMIVNSDQSARRDWREFQRIKNEICGEAWVGYEIYPPEHEAVDPSNAFFLWCFENAQLPPQCTMDGPRHFTPEQAFAPQRGGQK